MEIAKYDIEFTKEGSVYQAHQVERLLGEIGQFTDLLVLSHGWNNDKAEAESLYETLHNNMMRLLYSGELRDLEQRRFATLQIFWPSKKFADEDLIPGGGVALAVAENDTALLKLLEELKRDPQRLDADEINPVRAKNLDYAQALVPKLDNDPKAREEFVFRLRAILNPSDAHPDDGSLEFFDREPEQLFQDLDGGVIAPGAAGAGAAAGLHAGGAAGLGDLLQGAKAAARRLANFTTYYDMKQRAGIVGRNGLAQVLLRVRDRNPELSLHLVGHSFGGRLVTAAAHALPPSTPKVTISLLQAAYSHNGLGENYDAKGHDGAFRSLLSDRLISGPIIITHTKNDRAVGIAYPLASRISRETASAMGDENDPYGGMGRNGAQKTPEATAGELLEVGNAYSFKPGQVYNLRADKFIADHGDVAGWQVAYAILNAVRSV